MGADVINLQEWKRSHPKRRYSEGETMSYWDDFKAWYSQPFSADMDIAHWFLFLGLLIILMGLWRLILLHIKGLTA